LTCTIPDPAVHLQFLVDLDKRINVENAKEAHVLLLATIAHAKLLFGDLEGTKTDLNAAEDILNELSGVDTGVNAAFYGVFAAYCKVRELGRIPCWVNLLACRRKQITKDITETHCCTLHAST
jgi:hypothetical protein